MDDLLIFRVKDEAYALPITDVDEVLRMAWVTPVPESPPDVCGLVDVRGCLVLVIDPAVRLGFPVSEVTADEFLVLTTSGNIALKVQAVDGLTAADTEPGPALSEAPGFVRGYLQRAAGPVTVLDLHTFLLPQTRDHIAELLRVGEPRSPD